MSQCNSIESAEKTYCQRNKRIILKRAKDYYENDKERLREQTWDKYRDLSEEGKKRESMRERDAIICLKKRNKNQKNI